MGHVRTALLVGLLVLGGCGRDAGTSDGPHPVSPSTRVAIAGTVLDGAGLPVEGALVQPRSVDDPPREVPEMAVISGPDGRYEWSLPAGRYEFTAVKGDRTSPPVEVTAAAGTTDALQEVPLHLP